MDLSTQPPQGSETALLSTLDWDQINSEVKRQQRSRERDTPAISIYRWWARRSHALIGELLEKTADCHPDPVISDPFSGGGTVAIEAARRNFSMYAQDLHPWAIAGLRGALTAADATQLKAGADRLMGALADLRTKLYGTTCSVHGGGSEVLTTFWVQVRDCPSCAKSLYLFPYSLITLDSRRAKETHGWWGCQACGQVTRAEIADASRECEHCGAHLPDASEPLLPGRQATCPHAECEHRFPAFAEEPPSWHCVLVQRQCSAEHGHRSAHFDRPSAAELEQAEDVSDLDVPAALLEQIPNGLETRVLHRSGIQRWEQLYAPRQLRVLKAASAAIDELGLSANLRDRLRLALCGCAEMAGHVSRWDRYYPKAFEATANHRFGLTGLSCETNLLADRGRGTLPRRLNHSIAAAHWAAEALPDARVVRRRVSTATRQPLSGILLAQGSSARQLPTDQTVDLVLTDPPYFDDVQYAELAAVFLAWARACQLVPDSAELDLKKEAVANASRGVGAAEYEALLAAILTETCRTLKLSGRVILTYHNTDAQAWWALGSALKKAGLRIAALAVVHAENERDHAKRGRLGFSRDLVIECRRGTSDGRGPDIVWHEHEEPEAQELLIAGRTVASMPEGEDPIAFRNRLRQLRGDLRPVRISPSSSDRE